MNIDDPWIKKKKTGSLSEIVRQYMPVDSNRQLEQEKERPAPEQKTILTVHSSFRHNEELYSILEDFFGGTEERYGRDDVLRDLENDVCETRFFLPTYQFLVRAAQSGKMQHRISNDGLDKYIDRYILDLGRVQVSVQHKPGVCAVAIAAGDRRVSFRIDKGVATVKEDGGLGVRALRVLEAYKPFLLEHADTVAAVQDGKAVAQLSHKIAQPKEQHVKAIGLEHDKPGLRKPITY
jgi:hypothetical protein